MSTPLAGQVALVTGASRGIGRGVARHLAGLGAAVCVNFVRDAVAAEETVRSIAEVGGRAVAVRFDVADPESTSEAIREIVKREGRLDILVNNAGMTVDNLLLRTKVEDWDRIMAVNLRGVFNCTRAVTRGMIRARYGRIVNLSSVIGLMGNAGQSAYATAKAGIIGFTKSVARELASRGITVNAVAPGFIETEMVADLPEERRTEYLAAIPAGRLGTAEEVAALVGFLVCPESGYITGQVVGVSGGLYM
jgi:3-oxoacyl-[acyl-carrier protein] reductase